MAALDMQEPTLAIKKVQQVFGMTCTHTYFNALTTFITNTRKENQNMQQFINEQEELMNQIRAHKPNMISDESLEEQLIIMKTFSLIYGMGKGYQHEQTTLENDIMIREYDKDAVTMDKAKDVYTHIHQSVLKMETRRKENTRAATGKSSHKAHGYVTQITQTEAGVCYRCGQDTHNKHECPYKDIACKTCGKKGHTKGQCRHNPENQTLQVPLATTPVSKPAQIHYTNGQQQHHPYMTQPQNQYGQHIMMTQPHAYMQFPQYQHAPYQYQINHHQHQQRQQQQQQQQPDQQDMYLTTDNGTDTQ
eukprot:Awhi_evm1s9104